MIARTASASYNHRVQEREESAKTTLFERRRRIRRPWTLLLFGIVFLLLPFINYFAITQQLHLNWKHAWLGLKMLSVPEIILTVFPFVIGIGLLMVKRWGWWLFLSYAAILIVYDLFTIVRSPGAYNGLALAQSVLGIAAVIYFVRKDVSAPYMKMYPRGWRLQKRRPIQFEVIVDGIRRKTADASESGLFVLWDECYREPGEEVQVTFTLQGNQYTCRAGIVRVDENGAGVAFRRVDGSFRRGVAKDLARMEAT
ncbi:MAG TPA: PilZ domain-containing protein [Leptospiraceae bacterium]|nr:DUF2127 domain-containing protein [Leptospirales bacterium]HMU84024.1 PilZ domain-containing protein [Leptospiraceae bacterium]HMW59066.1 PilZ domain-containing protein [Leptospiraceae bacterium]HMX58792.1 PilZ domain-containing protein [Leptospiraceae bacterium]HNJ05858.1 PilZ domain-containing protein [Leptospiraceae bacterium]